jgi:hypothetical protein
VTWPATGPEWAVAIGGGGVLILEFATALLAFRAQRAATNAAKEVQQLRTDVTQQLTAINNSIATTVHAAATVTSAPVNIQSANFTWLGDRPEQWSGVVTPPNPAASAPPPRAPAR